MERWESNWTTGETLELLSQITLEVDLPLETQRRADVAVQIRRPLLQGSCLFRGGQSFVLFMPSTNWMRPTHIMEGNLLCSKSTDLNVNLIQKHPHRNIHNNV